MGWLSKFTRLPASPADPNPSPPGPAMAGAVPRDAPVTQAVQDARVRARRRLMGASVLLVIGILGFPLVFETQPRPVPVDLPIEIPARDGAPALAMPAPSTAGVTAPPAAVAAPPSERPAVAPDAALAQVDARDGTVPASAAAKTAAPMGAASSQQATHPPAADAAKAAAPQADRYVVQVGAFADPDLAHDARMKVERLGLKTYTQVIEAAAGKRIRVRVGPFAEKSLADQAAAKIKSTGLAAAVLTL
jgi:DedD protein